MLALVWMVLAGYTHVYSGLIAPQLVPVLVGEADAGNYIRFAIIRLNYLFKTSNWMQFFFVHVSGPVTPSESPTILMFNY